MNKIAVAPDIKPRAVRPPGIFGRTYDFRYPPWSPENSAGITCDYEVLDLDEALYRSYPTDAHLVTYVVFGSDGEPLARQPRITKTAVPWFYEQGFQIKVGSFFGDWDTPGHKEMTLDLLDDYSEKWFRSPWLKTAGSYFGKRGQRVVQELTEYIPVLAVEPALGAWLQEGRSHGILLDLKCTDWTHLYRAAKVVRDGKPLHCEPDLDQMTPRDVARWAKVAQMDEQTFAQFGEYGRYVLSQDIARYGLGEQRIASPQRRFTKPIPHSVLELPDEWTQRCETIAWACSYVPLGERHEFYRHLSGGLCHKKIAIEYLPTMIRTIANLAGHDGNHHMATARDTVARYTEGMAVTGFQTIQRAYPQIAMMLAEIGLKPASRRIEEQKAEAIAIATPPTDLQRVQHEIEQSLRFPEMGITVYAAGCGIGKTYISVKIIQERYQDNIPKPPKKRAPPEGRTVLSSDKHTLSIQTMDQIKGYHVPVERTYGPASLRDGKGGYVCTYQASAAALNEGGLSITKYLCLTGCPQHGHCLAEQGREGDEKAPVVTTVHAKLLDAISRAGRDALTIIDEPPSALCNALITEDDLECALNQLPSFDRRYGDALEPLAAALRMWLTQEPFDANAYNIIQLAEVVGKHVVPLRLKIAQAATSGQDSGEMGVDALDCAQRAFPSDVKDFSPPLRMSEGAFARTSKDYAAKIGKASRTLKALHECTQGITAPNKPFAQAEFSKEGPAIRFVYPNHAYRTTLTTQNFVAIMDANGELQVPKIRALTGREPCLKKFAAPDGASILRYILPITSATRSNWIPHVMPLWGNGIIAALTRIFDWARSISEQNPLNPIDNLYLMTYLPIAIALEVARDPKNADGWSRWVSMGLDRRSLALAMEQIGPVMASYTGGMGVGYFGSVRGLNTAQDCRATVTLGDPRPTLSSLELEAKFLKITSENLANLQAKAELEQNHGRLRAVQRKTPGYMLHVGSVLPGGFGWDQCVSLSIDGMTAGMVMPMSCTEFNGIYSALGLTQEHLSVLLGVTPRTLLNYSKGRNIPRGVAAGMRELYAKHRP